MFFNIFFFCLKGYSETLNVKFLFTFIRFQRNTVLQGYQFLMCISLSYQNESSRLLKHLSFLLFYDWSHFGFSAKRNHLRVFLSKKGEYINNTDWEKQYFTPFSACIYRNRRSLAASDLFHMFTQSSSIYSVVIY